MLYEVACKCFLAVREMTHRNNDCREKSHWLDLNILETLKSWSDLLLGDKLKTISNSDLKLNQSNLFILVRFSWNG